MKRNHFITTALEELNQEVSTGEKSPDTPVVVETETALSKDPEEKPSTPVTEVNLDQTMDVVAELMEKNTAMEDEIAELSTDSFDNDIDAIQTTSDTFTQDLEEAVQAGVALEELAHLAHMTARSGQANTASVASLAFAFEQITLNAGINNAMPALESEVTKYEAPKAQAEAVAKAAEEKSKSIFQKLIDGIKRIIGWLMNVIRQMFSQFSALGKRMQAAAAQLDSIDESQTINSIPFITSLRLVEGAGDPNKQFEEYAKLATKTLYGFFNESFSRNMLAALDAVQKEEETEEISLAGSQQLQQVLKTMMSVIFTEHANSNEVSGKIPEKVSDKDLTIGKTAPCVGGLQMFLAATLEFRDDSDWFCSTGHVKNPNAFEKAESIPVVKKDTADQIFAIITKWIQSERDLNRNLTKLNVTRTVNNFAGKANKAKMVSFYLNVLTTIATGVIPQFLRMNIQNSINFVTYVEKSIAVSKASYAAK